jgi:hypothetical protein
MSIGKWGWTPREVVRAIEVAHKTGLNVTSLTISRGGGITINTSNEPDRQPNKAAAADQLLRMEPAE